MLMLWDESQNVWMICCSLSLVQCLHDCCCHGISDKTVDCKFFWDAQERPRRLGSVISAGTSEVARLYPCWSSSRTDTQRMQRNQNPTQITESTLSSFAGTNNKRNLQTLESSLTVRADELSRRSGNTIRKYFVPCAKCSHQCALHLT